MRYTSRGRKSLALLLSVILVRSTGGAPFALAEPPPEPCILLKVSAASIPPDEAKDRLDAMQTLLEKGLHVRWVSSKSVERVAHEAPEAFPVADEEALEAISKSLGEAIRHMDRMETEAAASGLADTEERARSFRFGESTRPYLAEVFLRRGILFLWEGDPGKAEEMFARSRALRPEFSPDPAMFSPPFLDAWKRAGLRPPPQAELLVTSLPPGAKIYLDGEEAGTTPARVHVSGPGPVHIRVLAEGYLRGERTGQWLPGDFDSLEFPLVPDRNAVLAEILSSSPDGKEAGPILSRMLVETGARRTALLLLEEGIGGPVMRVVSQDREQDVPAVLGTVKWNGGNEGTGQVAASTIEMLQKAGWPAQPGTDVALSPWYHQWWFWTLVGVAVVGVAAGIGGGGGGGGSDGSSSGTIGVDF
jgi:hypothetical protein